MKKQKSYKPEPSNSGFLPPGPERRKKALGDLSNECLATIKALENPKQFWDIIRPPKEGDWLDSYSHG